MLTGYALSQITTGVCLCFVAFSNECVCVSVEGEMEAVFHPPFGMVFETEIFLGWGAGW